MKEEQLIALNVLQVIFLKDSQATAQFAQWELNLMLFNQNALSAKMASTIQLKELSVSHVPSTRSHQVTSLSNFYYIINLIFNRCELYEIISLSDSYLRFYT
jgi:hypothetical protein